MSYKDEYANSIESLFFDLENRIMADVVRRIRKTGEITSTADWQISRLHELMGFSSEEIEASIMETLDATYPEMFELYDKVVEKEYTRNKTLYEQINGQFIPYEENGQLQQWIKAAKAQTKNELMNITGTIGFVDNVNGQMTFLNLTDFYKRTMDAAVLDITSGAFDYNSTLKRTVRAMTNSGLRTINHESGYTSRVTVAARRAIMTGISQMAGKISDMNAEKLGTEHFEVAWHAGARPSHAEWQGKVWSKEELVTVCGLGTVTGLLGANCYHEYYPFFPGLSERNWSDEWLEEQNQKESIKKSFKGKEYNKYEATQKQRSMETAMRAQREKIRHLEDGGADPSEIIIQKAKYQGQLLEYTEFSRFMGLKQQRERIYIDGLGNVVNGRRSRINSLSGGKSVKSAKVASQATKTNKINVTNSSNSGKIKAVNTSDVKVFEGLVSKQTGMTKDYEKVLKGRFGKGKSQAKKVFNKFVASDSVAVPNQRGTAHFNRATQKVYMDYANDLQNARGAGTTFFHEHGHYIDFVAAGTGNAQYLSTNNTAFGTLLKSDFDSYVRKVKKDKGYKNKSSAYADISFEIMGHEKHSVSDIIGGLTKNQCLGSYRHVRSYWNNPGAVEREAFAHMFEAMFEPDKYKLMEKYFPKAFKEFRSMLKGLI